VALDHPALNVDGAAHGIDRADEFYQHPVAGRLEMRPRCSVTLGSTSSLRCALSWRSVPSSSTPINRL
jgi:hypothetical protein